MKSGSFSRSVGHQKGKIFGMVLLVVLGLSVYAGFVNVVSELMGQSFIEAVSLTSQTLSKTGSLYAAGDTMIVSARVKCSNVYRLSVYDNSDLLVFQDAGAVNGSVVNVSMPILPPAFNASRIYTLVFDED